MLDLILECCYTKRDTFGNVYARATLTSCRTHKSFTWDTHGDNARYFIRRMFPERVHVVETFNLRRKDMPSLTPTTEYLGEDLRPWKIEVFKLLWKDEELTYLQGAGWIMTETGCFISPSYPRVFLKVLPDPAAESCCRPVGVYVNGYLVASTDLKDNFLDFLPKS